MSIDTNTMTLGADPEVFIRDNKTGLIVASQGIVPGTKHDPFRTKNGYIQRDNVLAEFNVNPAFSKAEFVENVTLVLNDLREHLAFANKEIAIIASHEMDQQYLCHSEALQFGCDPDFDAWPVQEEPPARDPTKPLRSAGGHIHIGAAGMGLEAAVKIVRSCDLYLGLVSVLYDTDTKRRSLYGGPGKFRPKSYGVEYRTLSNFWLADAKYQEWIWDTVEYILENYEEINKMLISNLPNTQRVIRAIQTSNQELANEMMHYFSVPTPSFEGESNEAFLNEPINAAVGEEEE